MHAGFVAQGHTDLRLKLNTMGPDNFLSNIRAIAAELAERRKEVPAVEKITWYYRHWKESGEHAVQGLKNKETLPKSYIDDASWPEWMDADPRNP